MKKNRCAMGTIIAVLLMIGGVNWGLIGVGSLAGGGNWNVINAILGGWPAVEAIVYVLVGVSAIFLIFGCRCAKCSRCCKDSESPSAEM